MKLEELIRPDLLGLQPYSSARDEYSGKEGVFLDANENPFENGVNRYPDPLQWDLKKRIAEVKLVSAEKIFLGNGSDECIDLLVRLFCRPCIDKVVAIAPSYGMYSVSAKINQIELVSVLLKGDFSLDIEGLLEKGKDAKMIFLCSPNNPTGNAFSKEDILAVVRGFDGLVVVDEAYVDFSNEQSMVGELNNFPNLVVLQTFSKAYGMAGLRLGMLFGSPELVRWMNKIKPPYNINQLTQSFALERLTDISQVQEQILFLVKERERMMRRLRLSENVLEVFSSDSNFILVKVKDSISIYNYLILNKIISRNRTGQPLCDNCIRITIGTEEENNLLVDKINAYK